MDSLGAMECIRWNLFISSSFSMANKRLKGIKEHPLDITKSVFKRVAGIGREEARRRLAICEPCESKVPDKVLGGFLCDECWCNLDTLAYSDKGCDLNKW